MRIFSLVGICLFISVCNAAETVKPNLKDDEDEQNQSKVEMSHIKELNDDADISESALDEVKRKKKSATTTFCVEIRPSGPDQKPFQVCDTGDVSKVAPPYGQPSSQLYYPPNNYGAQQEQAKQHPAYQPNPTPNQPKPAYSAPVKTFSIPSPASASKPYPGHAALPYGTYRSKGSDEDLGKGKETMMMRLSPDSDEEEDEESDAGNQMRSVYDTHGYGGYSSPSSYIPMTPKKPHHKQHGHNGLVITCQPNLAGYAHNVPSTYHQPHALPSYSYRSSTPRGYGGYGRPYQPYKSQPQPYVSYHQAPAYKPTYQVPPKPQQPYKPPTYPPPVHSHPESVYSSSDLEYKPSPPVYPPPAPATYTPSIYKQPTSEYKPNYQVPVYLPQPQYKTPLPAYKTPPPAEYKPPVYPPPVPEYNSPTYSPPNQYKPPAYSSDYKPSYSPAEPQHPSYPPPNQEYPPPAHIPPSPPAYAPVSPPVYVPPGTYRAAVEQNVKKTESSLEEGHQSEKEKHTLRKMEEISEQRAADHQWHSELAGEETEKGLKDEHVSAPKGGWREADSTKTSETENGEKSIENEINETM